MRCSPWWRQPHALDGWDWVKWLPHAAHPRRRDGIGPLRMVTGDADDVRRWWVAELAGRAPGPGVGEPHLLVVVDEVAQGPGPWAGVAGVTVLRVGAPPGRRPGPSVVRLLVGPDRVGRAAGAEADDRPAGPVWIGRPDGLQVAEARALARRLARFRPAGFADPVDRGASTVPTGLPALLGLEPGPVDVAALRARWSHAEAQRMRVPIGVDERGAPVVLDLKESAHGGSGPHGLCVGATGSGKSELLRTLVLGLAATHSSAELNVVLVDFKGGATFLGLAALPHVSAVITNLADELSLVDRMADALAGEITRRQELLRAAGNLTGVTDYAAARRGGADLPSLPALLVVVDEFSELLAQRPELIELLVTIGRLGRSLGMHLLLASQRLDEGRLRGLESHLSYRIALRTFSAAESRAVLGVPDAHRLPAAPGSAFLATGTDELVRFRAAYVSGPGETIRAAGPDGPPVGPRAHLFSATPSAVAAVEATGVENGAVDDGPGSTVLDTLIAALAAHGPAAHRVWLPPLDAPPPLDEVLGPVRPLPGRGMAASGCASGALRVPVGLVDRPYQQRRDPVVLDMSGASGHLAVVGGPRSGKSTALATSVLGLALTHTPDELGIHVLDFGGGALVPLVGLPHVGTLADRHQPDLVRRTVAELTSVLAGRERLFREAGLASVAEFRARRAAGGFPDEPATDLLLVVDGYLVLRGEFDDVEAKLLPLAAQGLSYGVHLAVSANRWSELRPALKELLGGRFELRLGEPSESEVDRRKAAAVPGRGGHGLAPDGAPTVLAAPRTVAADTAALVARVAAGMARPGVRAGPAAAGASRPPPAAARRARRDGHPDRRRRGRPGQGGGRPRRRAAPRLLRRRGEREDHAVAGARPRDHGAVHPRAGAAGGRRLPPWAARRDRPAAPPRPRQHPGLRRGGGPGGGRVVAPQAPGRRGDPARPAGAQLVVGPGRVRARRRLRPRRPDRRVRASPAAAAGVPAAGQGRRPARRRHAAVRWCRARAVRPAARTAARARRAGPGAQRQPGRGCAGRVGQAVVAAAGPGHAGGPQARVPAGAARLARRCRRCRRRRRRRRAAEADS